MANLNTVISGIVEIQNKIILNLRYRNDQFSAIEDNIENLSGELYNLTTSFIPSSFYTKYEVEAKFNDWFNQKINLSNYYTVDQTNLLIDEKLDKGFSNYTITLNSFISTIVADQLDDLVDDYLVNYYTIDDTDRKIDESLASYTISMTPLFNSIVDNRMSTQLESYYTKSEINDILLGDFAVSIDFSNYYTKIDINHNFYNKDEIDGQLNLLKIDVNKGINKIESISINDVVTEIDSNKNVNIPLIKIDSLLFKVPELTKTQTAYFKIEFCENDLFENVSKIINTLDESTYEKNLDGSIKGIRVFTGMAMTSISNDGIYPTYSTEQILFEIDESFIAYPFFRYQWLIDDDGEMIYGRYGFGKISAIQTVFDNISDSTYSKAEIDAMMNNMNVLWEELKKSN